MRKRIGILCLVVAVAGSGCSYITKRTEETSQTTTIAPSEIEGTELEEAQVEYTKEDLDNTFVEEGANRVVFRDGEIILSGKNMELSDRTVTILAEGTYIVTGSILDGRIAVDLEKSGLVRLVFQNVSLACKENAPVYIERGKVILTLAEGTVNHVEDGDSYTLVSEEGEPSAAIYSKDDLTINGTGSLEVLAKYRNAIESKGTLKIVTGTYNINAVENGFVGRGGAMLRNGSYNIVSSGKKQDIITETAPNDTEFVEGGAVDE